MTAFRVVGPLPVPFYRGRAGRTIRGEEGRSFFRSHASYTARVGCYIFGMRAGRGITPIYVGKATNGFGRECFETHKLGKYNECLADYARGTPVLFLLLHPVQRGRTAVRRIKDLEDFLIQAGVAANPDLLNVKGTQRAAWSIEGVIRSRAGRPVAASSLFRSMMEI